MKLPNIQYSGSTSTRKQESFGGLNHNVSAQQGEIYDMLNMTSDNYPLISTRPLRLRKNTVASPHGIFFSGHRFVAAGTRLYVDGTSVSNSMTDTDKQFANIGNRVVIFPDKKIYTLDGTVEALEKSRTGTVTFKSGVYAGYDADRNTIQASGVTWSNYFKAGDALTISGCTKKPENNKTFVVREVEGNQLRFYENSFVMDLKDTFRVDSLTDPTNPHWLDSDPPGSTRGQPYYYFIDGNGNIQSFAMWDKVNNVGVASRVGGQVIWDGVNMVFQYQNTTWQLVHSDTTPSPGYVLNFKHEATEVTETGVTIARTVPDMDFICGYNNRIWGCKDDTIWCCKQGDPYNWNVFDGLASDSWSVDTGTPGKFTGCIAYLNYPIFFKEDRIFKIYGNAASTFEMVANSTMGIPEGSGRSLAVANGTLFYLSRNGVAGYNGGTPYHIGAPLGNNKHFKNAVGGSDGNKYYVSMQDENDAWGLYVYDTRYKMWHKEDEAEIKFMAYDGNLNAQMADGKQYLLGSAMDDTATAEGAFDSMVEFADADMSSMDKKRFLRIRIRAELEQGASIKAYVKYDSIGKWQYAGGIKSVTKNVYAFALPIRRCDHYRLQFRCHGACKIYALEHKFYTGGVN